MRIKEIERPRDEEQGENDRYARHHLQEEKTVGDAFFIAERKRAKLYVAGMG